MKTYQLKTVQILPVPLQEAWDFFTDPRNLNRITPQGMNFRILDELPDRVYPGMIIRYTVSPIAGIPLNWVTEITQVKDKEFFIDDQRTGPYRIWHHQHLFRPLPQGTEMTDIVTYAIPFGIFGRLAGQLFVHRKVRQIFGFRRVALEQMFPA